MSLPIKRTFFVMLFILLSYTLLPVAHAATFSSWGAVNGPLVWHKVTPEWEICGSGRQQSPISIAQSGTSFGNVLLEYPATADFTINNTVRSIQLDPKNPELFKVSVAGKRYKLLQFHIHTPSEHFLNGEHFPIELHFVHEQVDKPGALGIVGIFADMDSGEGDPLFKALLPFIGVTQGIHTVEIPFSGMQRIVNNSPAHAYSGSLTRPPCTEGVAWFVVEAPLALPVEAYRRLKGAIKHNARYIQSGAAPGGNLIDIACSGR